MLSPTALVAVLFTLAASEVQSCVDETSYVGSWSLTCQYFQDTASNNDPLKGNCAVSSPKAVVSCSPPTTQDGTSPPLLDQFGSFCEVGGIWGGANGWGYLSKQVALEMRGKCPKSCDDCGKWSGWPYCLDDPTFVDRNGYRCSGWAGYDCNSPGQITDPVSLMASCPVSCANVVNPDCTPHNCLDDPTFVDRQGYTCSGWAGYDCNGFGQITDPISLMAACPVSCTNVIPDCTSAQVKTTVLAAGDVSDYSTAAIAAIRDKVATQANVPSSSVEVAVNSASVRIDITVTAQSAVVGSNIATQMRSLMANPTAATSFLSTPTSRVTVTFIEITPTTAANPVPNSVSAPVAARQVGARNDPHFSFAHGGKADIRGADNKVYNLLSHKNVSMNVRFEEADFRWSKRVVHGTKISAAYWTLKTITGKTTTVAFETIAQTAHGYVATVNDGDKSVVISEEKPFVAGGIVVKMVKRQLLVSVGGWEMSAQVAPFPFAKLNIGKVLLNVALKPLYDVEKDVVAPHGLIGQSWDGDDVDFDGAMDLDRANETTTKAQGEGAIEGSLADYLLTTPFATEFTYSRYGVRKAAPRDTSRLAGIKRVKSKNIASGGLSTPIDMVEA